MDIKKIQGQYEYLRRGLEKAFNKYKKANSSFWVNSLCFYTIVSLVPMFAILLSIGTWFGMQDKILTQFNTYSPLKQDALNIILKLSNNLIENARGGILAGIGFVFLVWTLVSMFSVIENALNDVWHIYKSRTLWRKISDYIAFFFFLPLLFLILNGAILFVANKLESLPFIHSLLTKGIPYISILTFLFLFYVFMPNTTVNVIPAFISALVISIIFIIIQYLTIYLQSSINTYNEIYGSFSVIFIFFIWIRICWFSIILGAHLSYILQNQGLSNFSDNDIQSLNFNSKFFLTLKIFEIMVNKFYENSNPATVKEISDQLNISDSVILSILNIFEESKLVITGDFNDNKENYYVIVKNPKDIKINEIYNIVANDGEELIIDFYSDEKIKKIISNKQYNIDITKLGGI